LNLRRIIVPVTGAAALALLGHAAFAHHSTVMFKWGTEQTVEGTVSRFEWTQPHVFIWLDVPGKDGQAEQWGLEGMSPSWLARHGWDRHAIKAGDHVKVVIYPLRDGRPGGFSVRVIFPDGRTLEQLPQPNG